LDIRQQPIDSMRGNAKAMKKQNRMALPATDVQHRAYGKTVEKKSP